MSRISLAESQTKNQPTSRGHEGLTLPRSSEPAAFDDTAWGGRFPDRPYFPFYLGNGREAMLINISGSGDGHWDRPPYGADVLPKLHSTGWYRADRRLKGGNGLGVYGPLMSLGEFTACPRLHSEHLIPRTVRQYFDPQTATLTTFFEQQDDRSDQNVKLRIETWLSFGGILVQEIEVLQAPECGVGYAFGLGTPSPGYQNQWMPVAPAVAAEAWDEAEGRLAFLRASWRADEVAGFSLVGGAECVASKFHASPEVKHWEIEQQIVPLKEGNRFWRAVALVDSACGQDAMSQCRAKAEELISEGIQNLRERHLSDWNEYFSSCQVELPDKAAQHLYDLSRYLLRANHHPTGFQPVGLLPYQWQGVMFFWDATHSAESYLQCGNTREAEGIAEYIVKFLPEARELAKQFDGIGARYEWTSHLNEFTHYDPPCYQMHNNATLALTLLRVANYQGREVSPEEQRVIEESILFLVDRVEKADASGALSTAFGGIDESVDDVKPYDTWSFVTLLVAIRRYFQICSVCGTAGLLARLQKIEPILARIVEENVDDQGVLQSFRGGRHPHWGSIVFDLLPDHPAGMATLAKMSRDYDAETDLFNFHGLNRYAEKTFPWATFMVCRNLARMCRPEALSFFLHNLKHVNYFGGLPERIFYHNERYLNWFSTGHAGLLLAMNSMLVTEDGNRIILLGGIDLQEWPQLRFQNLHAGNGWRVSLEMVDAKPKRCVVENFHAQPREAEVILPALGLSQWLVVADKPVEVDRWISGEGRNGDSSG